MSTDMAQLPALWIKLYLIETHTHIHTYTHTHIHTYTHTYMLHKLYMWASLEH